MSEQRHHGRLDELVASLGRSPISVDELPAKLGELLRVFLEDGAHFVVLIVDRTANYYVQFLPEDGGRLLCEAVANEFLANPYRLSANDELTMLDLGWLSPDPNFKQLWDDPVPVHIVADRIVGTLQQVYRLDGTARLLVTVGLRHGGPAAPPCN